MNQSPTIICFGELLIDMIATNSGDLIASEGFLKKFGGAPANTAIGLAKLGVPVHFMGKVGDDPFGQFLKQTLNDNQVQTEKLILSKADKTTLAFVSLTDAGDRDFSFYIGAHEAISEDEVELPKNAAIFHFGSLTQTKDMPQKATAKLIAQAKQMHIPLSYDPNIRESLWGDMERARKIILETAKEVDIFKLNEEEALFLAQTTSLEKAVNKLFTPNLDALLITLGGKGCYFKTQNEEGNASTIKVTVVDTTGAGDAFNAGYLEARFQSNKRFSDMTKDELVASFTKSAAIAALTTTKKGAITAFPTKEEIEQFIHH